MSDTSKQPSHIAYHVAQPKKEGGKARWTRLGAMWPHQDGKGFGLSLDFLPVGGGRIELRTYEPKDDAEDDSEMPV
jgi:hypothetical protein